MPQKLVVANWKMNTTAAEAETLLAALEPTPKSANRAEVVICPPFVRLQSLAPTVAEKGFKLGAQNCSGDKPGAHTGEIAASMLAELGCEWVIIGHSERRQEQNEGDDSIAAKLKIAAACGLKTILCVGERADQDAETVILAQLQGACGGGKPDAVAYEPSWAIGSGRTPEASEIAARHDFIGNFLGDAATPILYGGSVSDDNIGELAAIPQCRGFLVGGASLDGRKFGKIVAVCAKIG